MLQLSQLLGIVASLFVIFTAIMAAVRWNRMVMGIAGRYKHIRLGKPTRPENSFTLRPPTPYRRCIFLLMRPQGELISGSKKERGIWWTNMLGSSLVLKWGEATIRASKTAEGVYEGYEVDAGEEDVKEENDTTLKKVSDSWDDGDEEQRQEWLRGLRRQAKRTPRGGQSGSRRARERAASTGTRSLGQRLGQGKRRGLGDLGAAHRRPGRPT